MVPVHRRELLTGTARVMVGLSTARADVIRGSMPWAPAAGSPPKPVLPGPWLFFTAAEGRMIEAIVDRIVPPDPETPGGKDAGCAVFIDRELAGPFGRAEGRYVSGPFRTGTKQQGPQSPLDPATQYRGAIRAIEAYCAQHHDGRAFADLTAADQNGVIASTSRDDRFPARWSSAPCRLPRDLRCEDPALPVPSLGSWPTCRARSLPLSQSRRLP